MLGNLTRDPELRQLPSGQSVCRLGVASNRQFKNRQDGTTSQEVCFVDVDVWGPQGESCDKFLQKGRQILIEGRLKFDSWEQEGQRRSKHFIVAERVTFLSGNAQVDEQGDSAVRPARSKASEARPESEAPSETKSSGTSTVNEPFEDELPF